MPGVSANLCRIVLKSITTTSPITLACSPFWKLPSDITMPPYFGNTKVSEALAVSSLSYLTNTQNN